MNYNQRAKQRIMSYYLGIVIIGIGGVTFLAIIVLALVDFTFPKMTGFAVLAMFAIGFGVILSVIFSRIGWLRSKTMDFLLNQLSLLVTVFGFVKVAGDFAFRTPDKSTLLVLLTIFGGVILAGLGMKYRNLPTDIS